MNTLYVSDMSDTDDLPLREPMRPRNTIRRRFPRAA